MQLSFVIPCYNEIESLPHFYPRLVEEVEKLNQTYEIIFVNDGSTDKTLDILKEFKKKDEKIKIIHFRRNHGKATALNEGFKLSKGEIVFTLDADLQDEPSEIPKFLEKIQTFDMLSGWKKERNDPPNKTIPTKLFNWTISLLSGIKLHDFNCGFKCYRREVIKNLHLYGEMHRFIPVLAGSKGFTIGEVVVKHNPREYGVSKYGLKRFTRGLFDAITVTFLTKFLTRPFHFFGLIGGIFTLAGFLLGFYLSILRFGGQSIGDRPLLTLSVLLIVTGIQLFSTGLIAEILTYNKFNFNKNNNISLEILE
jgi:glycosyltransferase involved in cell wall biosynthesis